MSPRTQAIVAFAAASLLVAACSSAEPSSQPASVEPAALPSPTVQVAEGYALQQSLDFTMTLTTTSIEGPEGRLHRAHSCERRDTSPQLTWEGVPEGAESLALVMEDPASDALGLEVEVEWTHWVVYSISPDVTELEPDQATGEVIANGAKQGTNDYERIQYNGPCPFPRITFVKQITSAESRTKEGDVIEDLHPADDRPYYFRLYALDVSVDLPPGADRDTLLEAIDGHIIAAGELAVDYRSTARSRCKTPDLQACLDRLPR